MKSGQSQSHDYHSVVVDLQHLGHAASAACLLLIL